MFIEDIKKITKENTYFRKVLYTGVHSQVVVMSIEVNDQIDEEVHTDTDQVLSIIDGEGIAILNGETREFKEHDIIFVPAGVIHTIKNTDDEPLKLFTIYSPPEHPAETVQRTKKDATT